MPSVPWQSSDNIFPVHIARLSLLPNYFFLKRGDDIVLQTSSRVAFSSPSHTMKRLTSIAMKQICHNSPCFMCYYLVKTIINHNYSHKTKNYSHKTKNKAIPTIVLQMHICLPIWIAKINIGQQMHATHMR